MQKDDIKISPDMIKLMMSPKPKSFRLPNGVAVIDFQNFIYSTKFMGLQKKNNVRAEKFIFDSENSELFIELAATELADFINGLPEEIEKVCVFSNHRDGNFHRMRLSKDSIPFEDFTEEDFKELDLKHEDYKNLDSLSDMYFDGSEDELLSLHADELLSLHADELLSFREDELSKEQSRDSQKDSLNGTGKDGFRLLKNPTSESISFHDFPDDLKEHFLNEYSRMVAITKFPKCFKHNSKKPDRRFDYDRVGFVNHMAIKDILHFFYANIIERTRFKISSSGETESLERSETDSEKTRHKREILHISTPLEDDFAMRLYIEELIRENPSKELSFYVYSRDRDVLMNFATIKNTIWIETYKSTQRIFLVDEFWEKIGRNLNGVSRRIIYGLFGSDYTTYVMNLLGFKRLTLKPFKSPRCSLKDYINRVFVNGYLKITSDPVTDESILRYIKRLSETIENPSLKKLFICCFDALIGFEQCSFKILTSEDIKYPSIQDRLNECVLDGYWKNDWISDRIYLRPDSKDEFEFKTIRTFVQRNHSEQSTKESKIKNPLKSLKDKVKNDQSEDDFMNSLNNLLDLVSNSPEVSKVSTEESTEQSKSEKNHSEEISKNSSEELKTENLKDETENSSDEKSNELKTEKNQTEKFVRSIEEFPQTFIPVKFVNGFRKFIILREHQKDEQFRNENKSIQNLIDLILLIRECKNNHSQEFFEKIIQKLFNLTAWKHLLSEKEKAFLKRTIFSKLSLKGFSLRDLNDYSDGSSEKVPEDSNEKDFKIQRKIIDFGRCQELGIECDLSEFSTEDQIKIIKREFN